MYCSQLNHTLSFFPDRIDACCSGYQGPIFLKNPTNSNIDFDDIIKIKEKFIKDYSENKLSNDCFKCHELISGEYCGHFKINKLVLNHFTHCNCKCIYCARINYYQKDFTEQIKKSDFYDIFPIIKFLYEKDLIDKNNLTVEFQGGDCTVLEEFEDIVNFLLNQNFGQILFTTNNILYNPLIEKCLKLNKGNLITSLDCGTKEVYKKIKRLDKFDNVISNLKEYGKQCGTNHILVKYIIVQYINDNLDELSKFLNLMKEIDIKKIHFDINYNDIMMNHGRKFIIPKHYYDMKDYCISFCEKNNIEFIMTQYTKSIMDKGFFE